MNKQYTCEEKVFGNRMDTWMCPRKATKEHEGRHYCWQHDPEYRKAQDAKNQARWDAKWNTDTRILTYHRACIAACEGIKNPQPGELAQLRQVVREKI